MTNKMKKIHVKTPCLLLRNDGFFKDLLLLSLLLLVTSLVGAETKPAPAPSNFLFQDGKTEGRLFLPKECGRPILLAAEELRSYWRKMTGTELPMAYRDLDTRHRKDVGIRLVVRPEGEWKGKESSQAFTIEETSKPTASVHITGVTITGNTETAVLYGVYQYLEGLGVRWFTPGDIGENVPALQSIPLTVGRRSFTPSFDERSLDLSGVPKDHFDASDPKAYREGVQDEYALWTLRNRLMFTRGLHRGNYIDFNKFTKGSGHGIRPILAGADFTKEPERFPMVTINGDKKRREKGGQICFTNEKNVQRATQLAVEFFEKQAATRAERNTDFEEEEDTFPMGLSDTDGICECDDCAKLAGEGPNSRDRLVWSFYNRVAKGLSEKMPGKKVGLYAPYFEMTRPPEGVKIEPNVVAVGCRVTSWSASPEDSDSYPFTKNHLENMKATAQAGAEQRTYDYTAWNGGVQMLNILDAAEVYHKMNVRHYHAEVMNRNEQMWPVLWTLAQYLWNSERTTGELLKEYCLEFYGKGGEVVLNLLKRIDANGRKLPRVVYGDYSETQSIMTDDLVADGKKQLSVAIKAAKDKEKTRLELFRDTFLMHAGMGKVYRSYCEALNERTPAAIANYKQAVADFEKHWNEKSLQKTVSPRALAKVKELGEVSPEAKPQSRKELADETVWRRELFSHAKVPETIENLFPLPDIWKFRLDYRDEGLLKGWEKSGYDDKRWQPASTGDYMERQGNFAAGGRFWYRVKFQAPEFPAGKKIVMRMGALDDDGDIYINGQLAYSRKFEGPDDWKSSFAFDVTPFLLPGKENVIAVRGYDSFGAGGIWKPCAIYTE
jgi:hypothetical protein